MSYIEYKKLLNEFVAIKSISTDKTYLSEIKKAVEWLINLFNTNGFKTETFKGPNSNPVVFASYVTDKKLKTILVYGHYDVQPASKEDGWFDDPFIPFEKNGKIYARGIVDNKGQHLIHVCTVLELIKQKKLKYNVKFLIEGNEETSNTDMAGLILKNKKKLACDYILISDGELMLDKPAIEYSLRGGVNLTIKYTTAGNNLHSGIYGGAVPNAANELSKLVSKFYDKNNKVAIPGFYEGVDKITPEQIKNNKKLPFTLKELVETTGVKVLLTENGYDFYTQIGLRPTLQITGFKSGYIGDGYSNIVPSNAEIRVNFRFVTSQKPLKILESFKEFVKANTPKYVNYDVIYAKNGAWEAIKININSEMIKQTKKLLERTFGEKILEKPVGGSIPVVTDFKKILGKDTLLVSLGNGDCNMHGVNENFTLKLLEKGLKFSEAFFSKS